MGVFKGAHITEQRVYADPSNPETSDFEVALLVTVPEAVTDTETGKNLRDILTEQVSKINDAKSAAETAQTAVAGVEAQLGEKADISDIPTSLPANGGNAATVNGHTVKSDVPANAKFTDTTYSVATISANGLMSSSDKSKLNGIATGANNYSLPVASSSTRGGVKIGYSANGKNYPVQLSNEQMFVNVPWTDTNTTYSSASASSSGLVSTGSQTFGGAKTFNGSVYPNGASVCGTAQARKLSSGTATATTSNCAAGCWYGKYE